MNLRLLPRLLIVLGWAWLPLGQAAQPVVPPVQRVDLTPQGDLPQGWAYRPAISADGRWVAFTSSAEDLVPGDANHAWDVFVRDLDGGATELVSRSSDGLQGDNHSGYWSAPALSADGRFVAFASLADNLVPADTNRVADVFVRDRRLGRTELISHNPAGVPANGWSDWPAISPDGRYVSFSSLASDLAGPGDTNAARDIYLTDRLTGRVERISVDSDGRQAALGSGWASAVSDQGRQVVFSSPDSTLAGPGDTNGAWDVFVRDRVQGKTVLASLSTAGRAGDGDSGRDSSLGISADGRLVVFQSDATTLTGGDANHTTDIFIRDWSTGLTWRASLDSAGQPGQGDCVWPAISPDGRYLSFSCSAPNLVEEDTNRQWDVFLRDRLTHHITRVSLSAQGEQGSQASGYWTSSPLSQNATQIAYSSAATSLVADNTRSRGWGVYVAQPAYFRGLDVVRAAREDVGMPYCPRPEPGYRGCDKDQHDEGCGGPYQGFRCGVCTDLVMDAVQLGSGIDIRADLGQDSREHPDHVYQWEDARSADDMARYFTYTQAMLAWEAPFLPGDLAFFDWEGDGIVDHVGVVSGVDAAGRPANIIEALGTLTTNPDGLAKELAWQPYHTQGFVGHVHP